LGSDFVVTSANVVSPPGTVSFDCPITSVGGGSPVVYACTGGSFSFQSTDGLTSVTGTFTTADLYLSAYGGGRGGNIKYVYQFFGNFTGLQVVNSVSAAINGETTLVIGPLTQKIGSGSVTAGPGATGVNSTYNPIYVTDYSNSQLVRSDDMFGTNKVTLGSTGTGIKQFYGPEGVTLDSSGRIYVVDTINCRIVRVDDITGTNWTTLGGQCGTGTKQFSGATDIALDSSARIYVADSNNSRIVRVDDMLGTNWTTFGTTGSGTNQLIGPQGVTVDAAGAIYIADTGNKRIVRIDDMTGTNWTTLTQSPIINGYIFTFGNPAHVALDTTGKIAVGDGGNVIRVDDMTGANWTTLGVGSSVAGVTVGSDGTTYLAGSLSSGNGVGLVDDIKTGAGFLATNLIGNASGIFPVSVPTPVPALKLSATSLAFGNQNTGTTSAAQTITLTNFGGAPLNFGSIVVTGDFVSSNTCPAALPGGSSCTISVSYAPTITGAETGTLTLSDNAFTGTQVIALSGTGTAPVAGIAPTTVTFQSQLVNSTSGGQFVALSNSGTGPLSFSGSGISTSGDFAQTNNCGPAVAPVTSCQVVVTFTPTVTGARTGYLYATDNAGTQTVTLAGTGASAAPTVTASPESLVYPTQLLHVKSAVQSAVLSNTGTAAVKVTSVGISGDFAKSGVCPLSLAAGKSCTLKITFTPTAAGTRTGTLTYTLSSGVITVALTGTGTATASGWLTLSPTSFDFNNGYVVGDNPTQDFIVTNTNGVPAGITKITMSGSKVFTQTNNCGTTVGANASCTITVTFTPTLAGTFTGLLTVTEGAGTAHKIPLSGTAYTGGGI
jgi:sugar lactone lactonase YvrE